MERVLCILVAVLCMCAVRQYFYNVVFAKSIKKLIEQVTRNSVSDLFMNSQDLSEASLHDTRNEEFARYYRVIEADHVHAKRGWPRGTWMVANKFGEVLKRGTVYVKNKEEGK